MIIFWCVVFGLIVGDLLCFFVFHLCDMFVNGGVRVSSKDRVGPFKKYFNFVKESFRESRWLFVIYYLMLDSITVTCTIVAVLLFGVSIKAGLALLFCYSLIVLTFVDARTQMLPDIVTKPLIILGLVQGYFGVFTDLRSSVIGVVVGYGFLWSLNAGFRYLRKIDGMGYGDFKLLAAIGAWAGFAQLPLVILASSFMGIIVALLMARMPDGDIEQATPFGPSLAMSGIIALLFGADIVAWYLSSW